MDLSKLTVGERKRLLELVERAQAGEVIEKFVFKHPMTKEDAKYWDYKFWNTQPVVGLTEDPTTSKQLKTLDSETNAYNLPTGYEWSDLDLKNDNDMALACDLLSKYYLEDASQKFKLAYTTEHLRWALGDTGFMVAVRVTGKDQIVGIVSAKTAKLQVWEKELETGDINFLCVHPKLREKGLAKVLIKEVTRRLVNKGLATGFFTTEKYVPTPFSEAQFYHRPINYLKLQKAEFVQGENGIKLDEIIQSHRILYKIDKSFRLLDDNDLEEAYSLYNSYVDRYNLYQKHSLEEFQKTYKNSNIVSTYGIYDDEENLVDFISYYKLPYKVVAADTNTKIPPTLNAAYLLMYTSNCTTVLSLFRNAIALANKEGIDVFNTTNIMENDNILFDPNNKFITGSGKLYYNFYNWQCPNMNFSQVCKTSI